MKACKDCKFSSKFRLIFDTPVCHHRDVAQRYFDPVEGEKVHLLYCRKARGTLCHDGKLWEPTIRFRMTQWIKNLFASGA